MPRVRLFFITRPGAITSLLDTGTHLGGPILRKTAFDLAIQLAEFR